MSSEQSAGSAEVTSSHTTSSHANQTKNTHEDKRQKVADKKTFSPNRGIRFPQKLLNVGFCAALILSAVCFITGALYLYEFLNSTNQGVQSLIGGVPTLSSDALYLAINARLVMAKIALLSCGVFIGMSFGFLGFALFLMGIREEMEVAGRYEGAHVKLARLSPGVFLILSAAILIGICVTHDIPFEYQLNTSETRPGANTKQDKSPANTETLEPEDKSRP